MTQNRKYEVMATGSGWGVWDKTTDRKIKSFGCHQIDRFSALKFMYMLYGWDWNRSKYVKQYPWLANQKFAWEA